MNSFFFSTSYHNEYEISAEHEEDGAHHSGHHFTKTDSVDEIENAEESESDNGEFITIKVTNEGGTSENEDIDRIKDAKEKKTR